MYASLGVTPGSHMPLWGKMSLVMWFLTHKINFWCFLRGKIIKLDSNSRLILVFSSKSPNFRFCTGGIPPRNSTQSRYLGEITPEMKRSRAVRIHNTKFCNIPTSMKKVMTQQSLDQKKFFFLEKKIFLGKGMTQPFKRGGANVKRGWQI